VLDDNLILKCDELFLVGQALTDGSHESAAGLYLRDTRHLSRLRVTIDGQPLDRLALQPFSASSAIIIGANAGDSQSHDGNSPPLHARTIGIEQRVDLDTDLQYRISVQNYNEVTRRVTIAIEAASDFRDLFDIRGFVVKERGSPLPVEVENRQLTLGYKGIDGLVATTHLSFDRTPEVDIHSSALDYPVIRATFEAELESDAPWILTLRISPRPAEIADTVVKAQLPDKHPHPKPWIVTDNPQFNQVIEQSLADLEMLQTSFPEGSMPAAGIPWYVAPFGRDSLITCLQMHYLYPDRALETLRLLSALQGTRVDDFREEQPGKILHEKRYGELARTSRTPHSPYYGTVDATPLFVMLFVEVMKWTGDPEIYRRFVPHVRRAINWIEEFGDRDGDGFIEYRSFPPGLGEVMHQGWKDSWDSINHVDGRPASGDIALVEVQGYVFAALQGLADVVETFDDLAWTNHLRSRAEKVRSLVEERFWEDGIEYYAQGLDGDKSQVHAVTSNPGHLLYCGLPSEARAEQVVQRLGNPDMNSGWGVRTLSSNAITYNPMSYHNGSVWPHDNSLIAAGFYRYGYVEDGQVIASQLFDAAMSQLNTRLPELYCGFPRISILEAPVSYPVTCSPQAWAAGSIPLLIRCFLGLEPAEDGGLSIRPSFPAWLNEITIQHLPYREKTVTLTVRRSGSDYEFESDEPVSRQLVNDTSKVVTR
jgi:glycogen debranching enzyme